MCRVGLFRSGRDEVERCSSDHRRRGRARRRRFVFPPVARCGVPRPGTSIVCATPRTDGDTAFVRPPRRTDSVTRRTCASCVRARALPSAPPAVGTPPGRYDEQCSTDDLYEDVAQPLVGFVARGGRATIFAYGQTGSGKARVSLYLVVGASRRACPRAKARCSLVGRSDVTEKRADGRAPHPKTSEPPSRPSSAKRSDAPCSAK